MNLYLGIDGGQSSTTALIGDETGRVIGAGHGGPCNHVGAAEGRPKFIKAITGCLTAAGEQAGLDASAVHFRAACCGFSGGPTDKEALLGEILRFDVIHVTNDALIALSGATAGAPGVITIAGTGSISFGRGHDRRLARAGGWGYIFGDEGGAFDLTRQALRAALRHEEGWGPPTALHTMLLESTGAQDANDLLHLFYTAEFPRPRIASLSKIVDRAAAQGDPVAHSIVVNSAQQLAVITGAVRSQVFQPGDPVRVAYIGGVFQSALLLERFRQIVELEESNSVGPPRYGPAAGALIEAYRLAGIDVELTNVPELEK